MKTKEELKQLKEEAEALTDKFKELSLDELNEIVGGEAGDWINRMKKKIEDYYGNTKPPIEELPSYLLPGVDPDILDKIIDKE